MVYEAREGVFTSGYAEKLTGGGALPRHAAAEPHGAARKLYGFTR